ncbi:hypothetical protein GQ56_0119855 [Burkholderia paludis]|uniref:hypothetical protein n=1 Tax=Burkholderia paludis TaxID=1506587 RepID=UPI0004DB656D|nr:hypothetical protein [Burkholderia paludis]KFG95536.1 hypothetical protein GQ56_0119855 [Burkholderia paludis]
MKISKGTMMPTDDVEPFARKLKARGVPRGRIEAMYLAQALHDYVSSTGREVVSIETVLKFARNYGLTTMAVLRAVIVLRSYGQIGTCGINGKLDSVSANPALFWSAMCVRVVADQQIMV